jgi:hypothetical protein
MRVIVGGNELNHYDHAQLSYKRPSGKLGTSTQVLRQADCMFCHPELLGAD